MKSHHHLLANMALLALPLAVAMLSGCATEFDLSKGIPWEIGKDGKFDTPMQVVAFWSDAVQTQPDKPKGIRGFGGRLYFYGKDPNKPVRVKGTLVIYAFDETNRDPKNVIPDKKYIFTPDQFQKKYSKSSLGDSYSIWLPWDEVGGLQKQISLVVRFTGEKGEMITSDEGHQLLPGITPEKPALPAEQNAAAQTAAVTLSGQPVVLPTVPQLPLGVAGPVSAAVQGVGYQQVAAVPGQSQMFSVMQTSNTSGVARTAVAGAEDQNGVIDVSTAPDGRMKTTTISIPQVPRPRFAVPTAGGMAAAPFGATAFTPGVVQQAAPVALPMQNQMSGQSQMPVQNQMPVQVQMPMQGPANNQGQMIVPGQMPSAYQGFPGQNGNINPTAPAMSGVMNSTASNGFPGSADYQTANAVRSGFDKPRVLGAPIARLDPDRAQWPLTRGEQPSTLASAPQLAPAQ
ncbi:MAG TPA: hypothetical protein VMJ32_03785 [Pirellulales bacterium]|nr:hypothetical protein [Pirellulales bacterium]